MYFLVIIIIIICVLLGLIILIQNPKGGGLSSNFSSSSQLLGVQKTGDILEKATWVLAIALIVLSLAVNVIGKGGTAKADNVNDELIEKSSKPSTTAPAPNAFPGLEKKAPVKH